MSLPRNLHPGTGADAHAHAHAHAEAPPAAPLSELTGVLVRTTEIAALRLNARKGVEGNEVLFRSGVTVTLSYEIARKLAEKLREAGECSQYGAPGSGCLVYVSGR